ncbi:MAG: uracil phosphoribosyltransferase [Rubritalea sp.]|jgi:uracil phosphoribosyltransferase
MIRILNHPVINSKITQLRSEATKPAEFRRLTHEIAMMMVPAVTDKFSTVDIEIQTPVEKSFFPTLAMPIVLVPILRAGLGLLDGFHTALPEASVAHIGMARNEKTLQPETYYLNAPQELDKAEVIILDPMLATGGSAIATVNELKKKNAKKITFVGLLSAPEGSRALSTAHPDIDIIIATQDRELNEQGFICPGLGDAGDRIFGTI